MHALYKSLRVLHIFAWIQEYQAKALMSRFKLLVQVSDQQLPIIEPNYRIEVPVVLSPYAAYGSR